MDDKYKPFLLKSGKSADDFGFWEDCRGLQDFPEIANITAPRYDLYIFTIYEALPVKWGLCYPEVCTQTLRSAI